MKHLRKLLIYSLSLAIIIAFTPAAFADGGVHKIHVGGSVQQSDAVDDQEMDGLLNYMNKARGITTQPLEWNDEDESLLITRAAELAINYSYTRLDGTAAPEQYHDRFVEVYSDDMDEDDIYLWAHMMKNEDFVKDMMNPDNKSFCAGVYVTDDGSKYIAMSFYEKETNKPSSKYGDYFNTFDLMAKDESLNVSSKFMKKIIQMRSGPI